MRKILLFGSQGQVGSSLYARLKRDYDLTATDRAQVDLTQVDQIRNIISNTLPQLIINAAAYTAVDQAEQEQDLCYAVNACAPAIMAEQAAKCGAAMIHYSTDYVFDGTKKSPYTETDPVSPLGVYSESKLQGDQSVLNSGASALVFRTSWVYAATGKNFYLTIRKLMQERDELNIVDDQIGTPTLATAIADASVAIIKQSKDVDFYKKHQGLYNMTCGGETSWYGFSTAIAASLKHSAARLAQLNPIPTSGYPTPAKRPAYTVLNNDKLFDTFGVKLPEWQHALKSIVQTD